VQGFQGEQEEDTPSPILKLMEERNALHASNPDSPDLELFDARIKREAYGSGLKFKIGADGSMELTTGSSDPGMQRKTLSSLEETAVSNLKTLQTLNELDDEFNEDFFTYEGLIKSGITNIRDKAGGWLGDPSKEDLAFDRERTAYMQTIGRWFNVYRTEITGAQATVQELDRLMATTMNIEQGPNRFFGTKKHLREETERSYRLILRIKREGLTGSLLDPESEASEALDDYFIKGQDDTADARAEDLRSEGYTDEVIGDMLLDEGYTQ
jgi:hypothetical protein